MGMSQTNDKEPKPITIDELIKLADKLNQDDQHHFACGWVAINEMSVKLGVPPNSLRVAPDIWQQLEKLLQPTTAAGLAASICQKVGVCVEELKMLPPGGVIGEWGEPSKFLKNKPLAPYTPRYTGLSLRPPPVNLCLNKEPK